MSDSIFDRLFEMFQSPGPVNWQLAAEVRKSVAGSPEPIEPHLGEEYAELATAAQMRLSGATSLDLVTPGRLQPVDRSSWASRNEQSFRYVIEPLGGKLSLGGVMDSSNPMSAMLAPMGPALLGMQAGTMVGFMSHRVLGQFDTGMPALDHDELFLVVPNVEAFASEHDLDPLQVRMWAAAHEVVHHAILGIEWMRGHIVGVMDDYYSSVSFDPSKLTDALSTIDDPSDIESMMGGAGGLANMLGSSSDETKLGPIQAVMSTIEGYGIHVVRRAMGDVLPSLPQLEESAGRRRAEPNEAEQFLQQLVGLKLERHRARDAAVFFDEIERRWGADKVATVWAEPGNLPTVDEITDPVGWAARTLLDVGLDLDLDMDGISERDDPDSDEPDND